MSKSEIQNDEFGEKGSMETINRIWIYEIQDGVSGGFILADTEEEARMKLSLNRGAEMTKDFVVIYPLTALDLNRDVHDLW